MVYVKPPRSEERGILIMDGETPREQHQPKRYVTMNIVFFEKVRKILLMNEHACPWWLAYTFDHRIRRLVHKPQNILGPYVKPGMTVADIGCGMGFFSFEMARLVGKDGSVLSVDLQRHMLEILEKRARRSGVGHLIRTHLCTPERIGIQQECDFALTFWMVHEVNDKQSFLGQLYELLRPSGKYLLVEPIVHTSPFRFRPLLNFCEKKGFQVLGNPTVRLSRAALFQK